MVVGFAAAVRRSDWQPSPSRASPSAPRGASQPHRSPTAALDEWLDTAGITSGSVFGPVYKGDRPLDVLSGALGRVCDGRSSGVAIHIHRPSDRRFRRWRRSRFRAPNPRHSRRTGAKVITAPAAACD